VRSGHDPTRVSCFSSLRTRWLTISFSVCQRETMKCMQGRTLVVRDKLRYHREISLGRPLAYAISPSGESSRRSIPIVCSVDDVGRPLMDDRTVLDWMYMSAVLAVGDT